MATNQLSRRRPTLRMLDGGDIGQYWAADNAQFETTNPNFTQRVVRQVNPLTGFGSNLGQLHTAVGEGKPMDAGVAVASSVPGFAAMRTVFNPTMKGLAASAVPSLRGTAQRVLGSAAAGAAYDEANAEPLPPGARRTPIRIR